MQNILKLCHTTIRMIRNKKFDAELISYKEHTGHDAKCFFHCLYLLVLYCRLR